MISVRIGQGRSRVIGKRIAAAPLAKETSLSLCNPMMNAARSISGQGKCSCSPDTPMTKGLSRPFGYPRAGFAEFPLHLHRTMVTNPRQRFLRFPAPIIAFKIPRMLIGLRLAW
jgi:hypothetical protein